MGLGTTLQGIEARAGLERRNGHPLWAYKLTEAEYGQLREELRNAFAQRDDRTAAAAAAFCLVAAHHFCRTHEGGAWSWLSIIEETRCPHAVGTPRFYDLVENGLRYWGVGKVLSTEHRRYYHRTLACQGGLPLKLLTGNTNNLQQFFRRLLRACEQYGQRPDELAPALGAALPRTLRNDIVYELASELVGAIIELRKRFIAPSRDPLTDLDRLEPGWRSRVPLQLDDAIATELLRGLLTERSPAEQGGDRSVVELVLALALDGEPRLVRRPRLAPAANEAELTKLLHLKDDLPPYFQLSLLLPDGTRLPLGSAHRVQQSDVFRLVPDLPVRTIRRGAGLLGPVRVVASIGESDLGVGDVPGGQPIAAELPWVLRGSQLGEEIPVRALGSARAAGDSMLLLLPAGSELTAEDDAVVESLEAQSPEGRRLVRLRGSASFSNADGDTCRFATGRDEEDVAFRLVGTLRRFAFSGSEVWLGAPKVMRVIDERERAVPSERIEWKPRRTTCGWRPWTREREPVGDVAVRVVEGGETVFRTFATIVPPALSIELKRLVQGEGAITLHHRELRGAFVRDQRIERKVTDQGGGRFEVSVKAVEDVAPELNLQLLFREDCEATVQVPCPIELRRFVGFDGSPLPATTVRAVDRLGGVRAVAVQRRAEDILLHARLEGRSTWRLIGELVPQSEDGHLRVLELSLDRVQSAIATLLAGSSDLDATVELQIVAKGVFKGPQPTLRVRRYDTLLEPVRDADGGVVEVRLDQGSAAILGDGARGLLRVDLRPLDRLDETPLVLEEISPGTWSVPWDQLAVGPWLVMGWQGQWARLRPLLISKLGDETAALDRVQRAIRAFPEDARSATIDEVLESLEGEYAAPEWGALHAMAGTLGEMPAMTFDVIRGIARRPQSATMLALHMGAQEAVWSGLEELPFLWAALPVRAWVRSIRRASEYAQSNEALVRHYGSPHAASQAVLEPFFKAATQRARFVTPIHELLARVVPGLPAVQGTPLLSMTVERGPAILEALLTEERKAMVRRASQRRWPNPGLSDLVDPDVWSFMRDHAPIEASREHRHAVFNAPALVAAASVLDVPLSEDALFEIRLVRDFDRDWFGFAHALSLTRLLAHQLTEHPEMYDDVR